MNKTINLSQITNYLQTKYHIKEVLLVLDNMQSELFNKQKNILDILSKDVPFPLSDSLKNLALENQIDLNNNIEMNTFLDELREEIKKLPVLTITLGINPTLFLIKEINSWVSANVKKFVVLDFIVDKSIISGAKIDFNGKIRDYSFNSSRLPR